MPFALTAAVPESCRTAVLDLGIHVEAKKGRPTIEVENIMPGIPSTGWKNVMPRQSRCLKDKGSEFVVLSCAGGRRLDPQATRLVFAGEG